MDQLIEKFYNLDGATVAEHNKRFNLYVKELENADFDANEFFAGLVPRNRQESNFRIKLLHKYKRTRELLETLINGDKISSLLIVKEPSFMEAFKSMPGCDFVSQICYNISFVTRCKLINRLSYAIQDVEMGKDYFNCVQNKYGLKIAKPLLLACDESFIKDATTTYEITFSQRQLIYIHKKYPSFITFYFTDYPYLDQFRVLSQYLCMNDLEIFHEIIKKSTPRIGKSSFTKFLNSYKDEIINTPNKIKFLFNRRKIYKSLNSKEYATFIKNLLPKSAEEFSIDYDIREYLKYLPHKARGQFLFNVFRDSYGFEIYPTMEYISDDVDILHPEDVLMFNLDDDYIEYYPIDKSIPSIKLKISLTSDIACRSELLQKLLKTCKFHKDTNALLDVLKYFCARHKNDNLQIRTDFVRVLTELFALEKLSEDHWNCINELILLFEVNTECNYNLKDTVEKFILYKILNNKDYTNELKIYWKITGSYTIPIFADHIDYQRECYIKFTTLIPEIFTEENDVKSAKVALLTNIIFFNSKHSEKRIPFSYYSHFIDPVVENDNTIYFYAMDQLIKNATRDPNCNEMLSIIEKVDDDTFTPKAYGLFLKVKPDILIKNLESLFKPTAFKKQLCYEISKMCYTDVHKKLTQYALDCLNNPKCGVEKICSSITFLIFHKPATVLEFAKKYVPDSECRINVYHPNIKDTLTIQKCLLRSFKYLPSITEALSLTLYHCKGDYLQYALPPLNYILYHMADKDVEKPIIELLKGSGSVRKHAIHLVTVVGCSELKYEILKMMIDAEKKVTLRKFIFEKIRICFLSDRTDNEWELLTQNLNLLDVADKESLSLLLKCDGVPLKYYDSYAQLVWNYLKDLKKNKEFELLDNLKPKRLSSSKFCDEIVKNSLFNENNKIESETYTFVYKYLLFAGGLLDNRIGVVFECVAALIGSNNNLTGFGSKMKHIYSLFETICMEIISKKSEHVSNNKILIDKVAEHLSSLETPYEKLNLELLIETTKFYAHLDADAISPLADFILSQQKMIVNKYGSDVIILHGRFLKKFLSSIFDHLDGSNDESFLSLAESVMEKDDSSDTRLLALQFIDLKVFKNPVATQRQNDVIDKIAHDCSRNIELHLTNLYCNM